MRLISPLLNHLGFSFATIVPLPFPSQDNVVEEQMTVDPKHHKHFVARRGEVLRQIGEEFGGVIVSFPRSGVDSDKVRSLAQLVIT